MSSRFPRALLVSMIVVVVGVGAESAFIPDGLESGEVKTAAAAHIERGANERGANAGAMEAGAEELAGALKDSGGEDAAPAQSDDRGRILIDNYGDTQGGLTGATFDDAQGFTTGAGRYRLTGVELSSNSASSDAAVSVVISEPAEDGYPGTTLYQLESPTDLEGRPFFRAPEDAFLAPNTDYLVRIDVTAGQMGWRFTSDKAETGQGLSGWSFEDHFWTSSGPDEGVDWLKDDTVVYALTLWGEKRPDDFGETSWHAGRLNFSRSAGRSPKVNGTINDESDKDWFNTTLSFDSGARYRIDVMPVSLTNDDDVGVRAFYLDNPHHSSGVVEVDVESVTDPPEGYVSWHFFAGRNFGPYIEVFADNDTTGDYTIRVVYDPVRVWTGTEVAKGDLPHDDTTWATVTVDADDADVGVYKYYEDHDWFAVELEEDTNYRIQAVAGGAYSSYIHPAIRLYDDGGNELASSHISHGDDTSTSVSITHSVGSGEDGTYYIDVTNAVMWDDQDKMDSIGITEPREIYSPFIDTRYFVLASSVAGRRNTRGVPRNEPPRILNRSTVAWAENTRVNEYITAIDSDSQDSITGYEITGGADQDLFRITSKGAVSLPFVPDYEVPADSDRDNLYEVQLRVTSGEGDRELADTATIAITITDDEAEPERVLVSNVGQAVNGKAKVENSDSAVRISTGTSSEGYVIHSVALLLAEALEDPSGIRVSLWSNHKPGRYDRPKREIFAFANPSKMEARLTEFTAPMDSFLEPDTSYWLMIERRGSTAIRLAETASNAEDAISEAGWNIGALRFHRPRNIDGKWGYQRVASDGDQLMLRVIGYERSGQ